MYTPSNIPSSPEELPSFLENEHNVIAENLNSGTVSLRELNVVPKRLYTGLTVLADGTNWNPGAGRGVYTYYNAIWNKLG
jgi:hypothetical protein